MSQIYRDAADAWREFGKALGWPIGVRVTRYPPIRRNELPLPWPDFNRRAKLYFRERVERNQSNHERNK